MKKVFVPVLLVVALVFSACGGGSDEAQIEALMSDLFNAIKAGDFNKAKSLVTEDHPMAASEDMFKMASAMMKDVKYELSNIKVDGEDATATLKVTMTMMGEEQSTEQEAKFKKVSGKWLAVE